MLQSVMIFRVFSVNCFLAFMCRAWQTPEGFCINVPVDHSKIHKVLISPVGLFTDMLFAALTVNKNVLLQIWAHSSLHKPTTPN